LLCRDRLFDRGVDLAQLLGAECECRRRRGAGEQRQQEQQREPRGTVESAHVAVYSPSGRGCGAGTEPVGNAATEAPTPTVTSDPTTAYHGHATSVANAVHDTAAMPQLMPTSADRVVARLVAPSRKTPRIGPLTSAATASTTLSPERSVCCIARPTAT